ncbi:MAG: sigma-54-dependent Fis family transcriptional regulator, partial [Calditrichaeota bacterium]
MGNPGSLQILVVEDNAKVRNVICHLLRRAGYAVEAAGDGPSALDKLRQRYFDLVITDYKMDRMDGLEVLQQVKRNWPGTQVIIITAFGSIPSGVEAIKLGAVDYLTKPFDNQELLRLVKRFVEKRRTEREMKDLLSRLRKKPEFDAIIGESPKLLRVLDTVCQVAETDSTIMIYGESGTGKELIARAIHDLSRRKARPFVPVNCAAIPENLQDSELFGHVKGAFTGATTDRKGLFEVADGGTVFLDEIAETALSTQVKLLRVLQESELRRVGDGVTRKVDIRLIAATNKDLEADVKRGTFREDLFYRINVIPIHVPPLR